MNCTFLFDFSLISWCLVCFCACLSGYLLVHEVAWTWRSQMSRDQVPGSSWCNEHLGSMLFFVAILCDQSLSLNSGCSCHCFISATMSKLSKLYLFMKHTTLHEVLPWNIFTAWSECLISLNCVHIIFMEVLYFIVHSLWNVLVVCHNDPRFCKYFDLFLVVMLLL
jgi:hypothetical protein